MSRSRLSRAVGPVASLLAILLVMFALSSVLAFQAWDAERSHRRATEGALRDYAGFATSEFRRRIENRVNSALAFVFLPVQLGIFGSRDGSTSGLASFALRVERSLPGCPCPGVVHDFFAISSVTDAVELYHPRFRPAFRQWLSTDFLPEIRPIVERLPDTLLIVPRRPEGMVVVRQTVRPDQSVSTHQVTPDDSAALASGGPERRGGSFGPGAILDMMLPMPLDGILALRDSLGFTGEQVRRLEEIRASLLEKNIPIRAEIGPVLNGAAGIPTSNAGAVFDRVGPKLNQARENVQQAPDEVEEVLTAEQWERLPTSLREAVSTGSVQVRGS